MTNPDYQKQDSPERAYNSKDEEALQAGLEALALLTAANRQQRILNGELFDDRCPKCRGRWHPGPCPSASAA